MTLTTQTEFDAEFKNAIEEDFDEVAGKVKDLELGMAAAISIIADELHHLAEVTHEILNGLPANSQYATDRKATLTEELTSIRNEVFPLIADSSRETDTLQDYTILHHVRLEGGVDAALRLAESLDESRALAQSNAVVMNTQVTAGRRDLEKGVEKFSG